jgi:hypothetical protein
MTTVPLPIQPLYSSMLPINPAKIGDDVLRLKRYLTNAKTISYYDKFYSSINNDTDNDRLLMSSGPFSSC